MEINLSKNFYTADKTNKEIYTPYLEKIIKCLETEKLLTIIKNNKKEDKDKLYFRLAFAELKDILTNAGTLLEVFIYFALKNSGFFNDVISNMKINWKGRSFDSQRKYGIFTQNEIDAAASKDAVTMLISAKNQNFGDSKDNILLAMYEINSLGIQFDAIPVLVSGIPDTIPDRYANRADKMKNMYLIRREDYMVKADELPQNPTYDEIAALEEAKLGKLLIEIIKKYI